MTTSQKEVFTEALAEAPLHRFADWPNRTIPSVCAGVYSVYDRLERFIYVGMAGAKLNASEIDRKKAQAKRSGLYDRLDSHASGYRSGDRFNIYVGDLYVLRTLSTEEIEGISDGLMSFDGLIREFIRGELTYRYVITSNTVVRGLETHIQRNGIRGERPAINGKS